MDSRIWATATKFWAELRRRRVVETTIAYAIGAWILIEVSATVFPALLLPEWTVRILVAMLLCEMLRPALCDSRGRWTADYVRLRFAARLP